MHQYENPLTSQYASEEMNQLFSSYHMYSLWRELWFQLALHQRDLGLPISEEALKELEQEKDQMDIKKAKMYEETMKHDVMAHLKEFGERCPKAKSILHLGVTSVYVKDNTELILLKSGMKLLIGRIRLILSQFYDFIDRTKSQPILGMTHFQQGQLTTLGKRAVLWAQSLWEDLKRLEMLFEDLPFRGIQGTVGSGDSFKQLGLNYESFKSLNERLCRTFGFSHTLMTGQIYDRKIDSVVLQAMNQVAQSAHKFSNDIRLLQGLHEIEEGFSKEQVGSSAMAYKRNPILSERMSGLCKFVMSLSHSGEWVAATQWLERTLDDSACRRLTLSQVFLATDAILILWERILKHLNVYPEQIEDHIQKELPFFITERLIMEGVKQGGDRQVLHEKIRSLMVENISDIRQNGDLEFFLEKMKEDSTLVSLLQSLNLDTMNQKDLFLELSGFAVNQCEDFLKALKLSLSTE